MRVHIVGRNMRFTSLAVLAIFLVISALVGRNNGLRRKISCARANNYRPKYYDNTEKRSAIKVKYGHYNLFSIGPSFVDLTSGLHLKPPLKLLI